MLHQDYESHAFRVHSQPELSRWDSQATFNQACLFDAGNQSSDYHHSFTDNSQASTTFTYPSFERKDSMCYTIPQPARNSEVPPQYSFHALERKDTMSFSGASVKAADQVVFTEFELPSSSDYGLESSSNQNLLSMQTTSIDRRTSASSNNMPVSLPEASFSNDHCGNGLQHSHYSEEKHYHSDSSCSASSSRSTQCSNDVSNMSADAAAFEDGSFRMTRVDWRWAAMKGFWDKDKKCWIESAGGQAAYILQRMKRVKVRQQRLARQAKALQRLVPVQNLPFRSGLVEELPYRLDNDPWTEGLSSENANKSPAANVKSSSAPTWFDSKSELCSRGSASSSQPVSVQVFPFARTAGPEISALPANSCNQWSKQVDASQSAPAMQWFEKAYASSSSLPVQSHTVLQNSWAQAEDTTSSFRSSNSGTSWPLHDPTPTRVVSWW